MSATVFDGWLRTRRDRITASLALAWFAVLGGLVLLGYAIALALLAVSAGYIAGILLAYPGASALKRPFARLSRARRDMAAAVLALVLMLAILIGGFYATGASSLIFAEDGKPYGSLVYGLALGFGNSLRQRLAPQSTPEEKREDAKSGVRFLLVVCGAAAGIFALTFAAYVLFEYALGPVVRFLVP